MVRPRLDPACFAAVAAVAALAATQLCACAVTPKPAGGSGGSGGGASGTGGNGPGPGTGGQAGAFMARPVTACPDPQAWTAPAAPAACTGTAPAPTGATADATLAVDAGTAARPWNRFYEKAVASDHAATLLCTAYGRNIQNALRKAHAQAGFQYVRFHGVMNDDMAVYAEDASGAPIYDWTRIDAAYDAIVAAGMRPMVEVSFTPIALASDKTKQLGLLWYSGNYPNISPPTGPNNDWSKWRALMAEFVRHLEARYGADEVRTSWYFEVWNEPSWMYTLGDDGYFELYENTVAGLLAGDPAVRVGGPAGSSGESPGLIYNLINGALTKGIKLDFITYHRYGDDDGLPIASVTDAVAFHANVMSVVSTTMLGGRKFAGEVINNEFGPSWMPALARDNEIAISYIIKTIHLLGAGATVAPPSGYGYWAVSDLYEEISTGNNSGYRPGNYGLLLKGDPPIAESYDVAKPSFNAFRLLHMMGAEELRVTGGVAGDGVGAAATRSADGRAVQVLIYNHVNGGLADSSKASTVSLTVNNLPAAFTTGPVRARRYIVDRAHANSYRAWVAMGSPPKPTQAQWVTLRDAAELCYFDSTATATAGTLTLTFPQNIYGATLFEITPG